VMDRRVWTAMLLLLAGGMVLIADRGLNAGTQLVGLMAVLGATAAWGVDNTLSRALAERDPGQVVLGKCAIGAIATGTLAVAAGEPVPGWGAAAALLAIGASGYGLSLRFYLLAARVRCGPNRFGVRVRAVHRRITRNRPGRPVIELGDGRWRHDDADGCCLAFGRVAWSRPRTQCA